MILCVNKYTAESQFGDSGGPVFTIESDDHVALTGIHTGATGWWFFQDQWYSDIGAIQADLGTLWVLPLPGGSPLTVEIQGPSEAPLYYQEGCDWWVNVSGGGGSYTYQWKWDGQVVGSASSYSYGGASQGQHSLEVIVSEGASSGSDAVWIDVAPSNSCFSF